MFNNDPRYAGAQWAYGQGGFNSGHGFPASSYSYQSAPFANAAYGAQAPATPSAEWLYLYNRIEEMRAQLNWMNEMFRAEAMKRDWSNQGSFAFGHTTHTQRPVHGFSNELVRVRETEAHLFCEIFIPQLTAGDVEVEVSGNRIICRTRFPLAPIGRWFSPTIQMPRGFEFFELPDGRIECTWFCPVTFAAKDVEATVRDGFLSIFVPKTEMGATATRHTIKVAKDTTRRAVGEMNS